MIVFGACAYYEPFNQSFADLTKHVRHLVKPRHHLLIPELSSVVFLNHSNYHVGYIIETWNQQMNSPKTDGAGGETAAG